MMKTVTETLAHPRLQREMRLQNAMITMYCKQHHVYQGKVCRECDRLQQMSARRLAFCESGTEKPTCATCTAVCYTPIVSKQVKAIYRWGCLRVCLRHPILMSLYCFDSLKASQMPKPKLLNL